MSRLGTCCTRCQIGRANHSFCHTIFVLSYCNRNVRKLVIVASIQSTASCVHAHYSHFHNYNCPALLLLSTHADRQSVDISFTVFFVCVCTVTDFSGEDKASGVKFCTVVHRHNASGISHFGELVTQKPKIRRIG